MDNEKEISFGAFDSELMRQEITIPKGFEATIDGNKIILTRIESEDERIRKELVRFHKGTIDIDGIKGEDILAWLEKQGQKLTDDEMTQVLRTEYEKGRADAFAQMQKEWSEEDECTLNGILDDYKSMCKTYRNWLESLKNRIQPQQKQEWSEEDEVKINRIVACLENLNVADNDILLKDVDWLKSLKERYFWKPNVENRKLTDINHEYFSELLENDDIKDINDYAYQVAYCMSHDWIEETATWDDVQKACKLGAEWNEKRHKSTWSEEDKKMIGRIRSIIEKHAFSQSAVDVNGDLCEKEYIDTDNFLKSLKERCTWKPSDKQMENLSRAFNGGTYRASLLMELYQDLKKLKGE